MQEASHPHHSEDMSFELAASGLLQTDATGKILRVNAMFCQWLGYTPADLIQRRRFQGLFTMGGRVFYQTHWAPLIQIQGSVSEVKLDMVHRDGHSVPMLLNAISHRHGGQTVHEVAVMMVTDRHKFEAELVLARRNAEAALAAREQAQQALQETTDVLGLAMRGGKMGVWSRNLSTNHLWFSRELEELVGVPTGGLSRHAGGFLSFIHEQDRLSVTEAIDQALASASDYVVEFRFRHASGQWRWMEGRGQAVYDPLGQPKMVYGLAIDITERKDAVDQVRRINDQLSEADRRKDEFLATLAHELRNPLAPMRNVLQLLKLKNIDDPQILWSRDVMARQVHHLTHLVDDLLEVSRITQGKLELRLETVDLTAAIEDALEATQPLVEASSHQLSVQWPAQPISLNADPMRLTQMIQNLVNNAAKYTPSGGHIWITADRQGDQAVISVRDSGIGIAKEHLAGVFDMFSQLTPALDRSQGGLGIGLSLVRGLVELHGGTIEAKSDGMGLGSEFVLQLPARPFAEVLDTSFDDDNLPVTHASKRILVVDDNQDAADSLQSLLDLQGHDVMTAHDGVMALQLAQEFSPELVLLDIGLPLFNGYEVAQRIRKEAWGQSMCLVALTGWGQSQDKQKAMEAGFDRHLTKPVEPEDLHSILDTLS